MADKVTTKPGFKTTEFWMTLAALVFGALLASGAIGEHTGAHQIIAFLVAALAALGYTGARAFTKNSDNKKEATISTAIPGIDGPSGE